MAKKTARTGILPFAHLIPFGASARAAAKAKAEEEDKPEEEAASEEEDDKPEAEEDKPDESAETETEDKPESKGKRAKAKAEDSDTDEEDAKAESLAESEDDDEDMAKARREGFLAAQARGRRIFNSDAAAVRPDMAAHYAFNDSMPSAKAITTLEMAAAGGAPRAGSRLAERMARVVLPNPGPGAAAPTKAKGEVDSFVEMALAAGKKAGIR